MTEGAIEQCEKQLAELNLQIAKGPHADLKRCEELIVNLKVQLYYHHALALDNTATINTAFHCAA